MRIAIDAMGGDCAPAAPVGGALRALAVHDDIEIVLVGDPQAIEAELAGADDAERARIHVHAAPDVVEGGDPVRAVRATKTNSARVAAELLRSGDVDGVVTMGNTGAAVAAATLYCRRLPGVRRLGIAVPFPRPEGATVVIDAGANPDARPEDLHQYAIMASLYARLALGVEQPRVGILSIGEEEHKGNRLVAETWERFRAQPFESFVGNVEPRELFEDRADVVVCDGFTGNISLKAAEGMAAFVLGYLEDALGEHAAALHAPVARALAARVDYARYGGAPLLGLDGGYVIGHGRSGPEAFESAITLMRTYVEKNVSQQIVDALRSVETSAAGDS